MPCHSTGGQGNTIKVFTFATILFLPASFMASFFALPVTQFSRDPGSDNMDLAYIIRSIPAFTLPVAVVFICSAFYINEELTILSRLATSLAHYLARYGRVAKTFIYEILLDIATRVMWRVAKVRTVRHNGVASDWEVSEPDEESIESGVTHRKGFALRRSQESMLEEP
ncbi:hypothetical protein BDW60DRAFT_31500 [Aspergillus nidulans var. acristatus]